VRKADRPIELPAPRHLRAAAFDVGREAGHVHKRRLVVIDLVLVVPLLLLAVIPLLELLVVIEFFVVKAEKVTLVHPTSPGKGIEHRSSPNDVGRIIFRRRDYQ
jgi:hypothetical protein